VSKSWLIYHEDPITLSSGRESHWFVDGRKMFKDDHLRESVLNYWCMMLTTRHDWHCVGVPKGGIPWAEALQDRVDSRTPSSTESRLVIVEDVITTGQSALKIQQNYGVDVPIICVVLRGMQYRPLAVFMELCHLG